MFPPLTRWLSRKSIIPGFRRNIERVFKHLLFIENGAIIKHGHLFHERHTVG
jgi:hypothetical protein